MAEPQLFPNQPSPSEHIQKHKGKDTPNNPPPQLNSIATRLKILEERYSTLRKKTQTTEHNVIEVEKNHYDDLRIVNDDISEIKHKLRDINEKLSLLTDEIQNFAHRNDLKVLEKFVDYWQPVDFVTRKEINDFLRKRFAEQKPKVQHQHTQTSPQEPSEK